MSEEPFENNPFRNLDLGQFPDQRPTLLSKTDLKAYPAISLADRQMFLRAVEKVAIAAKGEDRPEKATNPAGFSIAEQCSLPKLAKMKNKQPPEQPKFSPVLKEEPENTQEDEENAFLLAMRAAKPLSGKGRKVAVKPTLCSLPQSPEETMEAFMGSMEFAVSSTDEYLEGHVVGLDELIINRLREGQFSPEAHLDLHGLNSDQAYETLKDFIRQAWFKDLRTLLLVPGRGLNSPNGLGILRQKLQFWLTREPFKRVVLAFCTAKPHDGGPGSIYVLLRRQRKKGPVQWERQYIAGEWD